MSKPSFVYVTYIASTPEKVWDALTNGEITRHYWAHRIASDWKGGSKWKLRRLDDTSKIDVQGQVIESVPPQRLVISWERPDNPEGPAGVSRVTFEIETMFEDVRLTVKHEELQPGSPMLESVSKGWPAVLCSLKSFLETGRGLEIIEKWTDCRKAETTAAAH